VIERLLIIKDSTHTLVDAKMIKSSETIAINKSSDSFNAMTNTKEDEKS
jgi:hypothetical protein